MAKFDSRQVAPLEWVGVGAGVVAFVVSFFSWRHVSGPNVVELARTLGLKTWYTAWGSGVTGWLPVLLLVGAGAVILARGFGLRLPGVPFLWLAMAFAAVVLVIARWLSLPDPDPALLAARNLRPEDIDTGPSIGLFLGLIAAALSTIGAVFRVLSVVKPTTEHTPPQQQQPPTPPTEPLV